MEAALVELKTCLVTWFLALTGCVHILAKLDTERYLHNI